MDLKELSRVSDSLNPASVIEKFKAAITAEKLDLPYINFE